MTQLMSVRRIAVALRLMDSFTGQVPAGVRLSVAMADGAVPVRKADGYYIFWDNGARERTLTVRGSGYEAEEIQLDMEQLSSRRQPTYCLWLKPDGAYAYPRGMEFEERQARPGAVEEFPLEGSSGCLHLADAYPMDKRNPGLIRIQAPEDMELENRRLYMEDMDGNREFFTVWAAENRAMGLYRLMEPLKHIYGPYESRLLLTMALKADRDGRIFVPVSTALRG